MYSMVRPSTVSPGDWIDIIEIIEKGKYNKDGKYWPFKARIKYRGSLHTFMSYPNDFTIESHIYLDDFGKYKIERIFF